MPAFTEQLKACVYNTYGIYILYDVTGFQNKFCMLKNQTARILKRTAVHTYFALNEQKGFLDVTYYM